MLRSSVLAIVIGVSTTALALPKLGVPKGIPGGDKVPGGSCNDLSAAGEMGARLQAFFSAASQLEKLSASLESSARDACKDMAATLQVLTAGDTKALCARVAATLKDSLKLGVNAKAKVAAKVTPAKCTVKADVVASGSAACAGKGSAAAGNGGGKADAAGACQAGVQARANLEAECTPPKASLELDTKVAVDASKAERAKKAIESGLPALLAVSARAGWRRSRSRPSCPPPAASPRAAPRWRRAWAPRPSAWPAA